MEGKRIVQAKKRHRVKQAEREFTRIRVNVLKNNYPFAIKWMVFNDYQREVLKDTFQLAVDLFRADYRQVLCEM